MMRPNAAFQGTARFEVLRTLGEGGVGIVYEAFDRERECRVALKTLRLPSADGLARFKREFRALQDLQHPNLVHLDELFESEGTWFFTMELVKGDDFITYVRSDGAPKLAAGSLMAGSPRLAALDAAETRTIQELDTTPVERPVEAERMTPPPLGPYRFDERRLRHGLRQLVLALSALHGAHKVHRDVKPSNILVTADERLVLLDFGLIVDAFLELAPRAHGTMAFMAPEQLTGVAIGPAADWYAVGVTLYQALTGRRPFVGSSQEIAELKVRHDPAPPGALAEGIPIDLDQLCLELLARDPRQRPMGPEILDRLGAEPSGDRTERRPQAPFVGRGDELAALRAAYARAQAGDAVAVLVHGESGVGKSALVRRFLEEVSATGAVTLAGRCYELESVPYKALDEVMEALGHHLAGLPRTAVEPLLPDKIALITDAFPTLRQIEAVDHAVEHRVDLRAGNRVQSRVAVFVALRELWARLRQRGPLVVAIDDLQWADADSLTLLAELTRAPVAPPILLCATVRTPLETGLTADELRAHLGADVRDLLVDRLPPSAARELATKLMASSGPVSAAAIQAVAAEAGGHPMFIEALVSYRRLHPAAVGTLHLDEALVARAEGLGATPARLLELVCVAGRPVRLEICAHAIGMGLGELAPAVTVLRAASLIKTHGIRRGDAVEPYHDRVRESVVATLVPAERRTLHARLAGALERSGQADPETLAIHFREGGDLRRAGHYAAIAAEQAYQALAFERSARLYDLALELDPGDAERTRGLRLGLAEALANAGRGLAAAEIYIDVAAEAPPDQQLDLRWRAAEQLLMSGRTDEGARQMREVLTSIGMKMPETLRGTLLSLVVNRARVRLRRPSLHVRLRDPATIPPDELARIDVCWSMAVGMAIVDPFRGADFQTRHILLALRSGDPYRIACALAAEASFSAANGGRTSARTARLVRDAEALAREVDHPNALGYAAFAAGIADYCAGGWRRGRDGLERAAAIFRERCAGVTWWIDSAQYCSLECLFYAGEVAELCRRVPALLADAQARGDLYASTNLQIGLPHSYWLFADDLDGARRHMADGMAGWSAAGFHIQHEAQQLAQVQTHLYAGDAAAAYARVVEVWPALSRSPIFTIQLSRIAGHFERGRAALAAAEALPADAGARRHLLRDARRSARRIVRERMAWGEPLAALVRAGARKLAGDDAGAVAELDAAIAGFDATGMALDGELARLRRGELVGGDEGAALRARAIAWMVGQGIKRPDRIAAMLAPGFS